MGCKGHMQCLQFCEIEDSDIFIIANTIQHIYIKWKKEIIEKPLWYAVIMKLVNNNEETVHEIEKMYAPAMYWLNDLMTKKKTENDLQGVRDIAKQLDRCDVNYTLTRYKTQQNNIYISYRKC